MAETPNPTMEQYWAMAALVDGRVSVALREIQRRLETNLPGLIDKANDELGYTTPDVQIRKPDFYSGAPTGLEDHRLNGILVGAAVNTEFEGSGQFKNLYQVSIMSIDERIETQEQYHRAWDRLGLIRVALFPFTGGCVDADNRVCWRSLVPTQGGVEFESWEEYGGLYAHYSMVCEPSQNIWSVN